MLIVLSPAKTLDMASPVPTARHGRADFLEQSARLIALLRAYSPAQLGQLMGLSEALTELNVARYAHWHAGVDEARQAVMAFNGEVYAGLDARTLKPAQLDYTERHVRILSGLYGLLRPLDLILPHRLEMGTRLANPHGKDLYAFWGERITDKLNETCAAQGAQALINLASEEYFRSVKPGKLSVPVITPVFEDWKGEKYKVISFYAKRARGLMARYAAQKGITEPDQLKRFKVDGYQYAARESSPSHWIFRRKQAL